MAETLKRVSIEIIPHSRQRYDTCGDWEFALDGLHIRVSDTGDWRMNMLIARHEFDEALLCLHARIDQSCVDEYDFAHPDAGSDSLSANADAPYARQHNDALAAEWQFARLLDVDWRAYGAAIEKLGKP